jgi:hypothetical protein
MLFGCSIDVSRPMFPTPSKLTLLLLGIAITAPTAQADVDLQSLVTRSPFGEGKTGAGGERVGSLEFRGYYVDNGITYFSIYNPSSKSSVWVAQGETSTSPFAVSVKNFDSEKNAVTLESNGQSMRLSLHEAVIVKMDLPAPPAATPNNGAAPIATTAVVGSANAGQAPTAEQAQSFKDSMRQRWQDRQNQNGGNDNNKNKGNKGADNGASSETTNTNSNRKNKNN